MTEEEKSEKALWDQVLAHIPVPFRRRTEVLENAVVLRSQWAGRAQILASINRRRDGYENDVVIMNRWPLHPTPLRLDQAEVIANWLTDAAFEMVRSSLPLVVAPPLEHDVGSGDIFWEPTGERTVSLGSFETIMGLREYMLRVTGLKYRDHLVDVLRKVLKGRTGKEDTTVERGTRRNTVRRKDRTVEISGYEPMASIFLGGGYGREGRTVAAADYGVIRDEDLLAPAVSFLAFEN